MNHVFVAIVLVLSFHSVTGFATSLGYEGLTKEQLKLYQKIGDDLRCPTCTGLSVLQSEADFAVKIREAARSQVLEGKTEAEIMLYFTERYGLWILRKPPIKGFHILAWAIPIGLMLLGALLIWVFVWRKRKSVDLHGVRPTHAIISEMEKELDQLRAKS